MASAESFERDRPSRERGDERRGLYEKILGLPAPWQVKDVELELVDREGLSYELPGKGEIAEDVLDGIDRIPLGSTVSPHVSSLMAFR